MSGVAILAGGGIGTVVRLGISMTALQFAIGALNDIVDAPRDVDRVPPKPIPAGLVSPRDAQTVAVASAAIGIALALPSGLLLGGLALVVLAIGAAYDLFAKGTAWSWLPFAVGIPVLPIYGWLGATGSLPASIAVLLPMAALAGAGLAVANARADLGADAASGTRSIATALGPDRSWWAGAALMTTATVIGAAFVGRVGSSAVEVGLITVGTALVAGGISIGRASRPAARRQAWMVQAVGAALAGVGWVSVLLP